MKDTGGMSLRDYFAAAALQGILACQENMGRDDAGWAVIAYSLADAMLKEREK